MKCVCSGFGREMQPSMHCKKIWFMQSQNDTLLITDQVRDDCWSWDSASKELPISSGRLWYAHVEHSSNGWSTVGRSWRVAKMSACHALELLQGIVKLRVVKLCHKNTDDDVSLSPTENPRISLRRQIPQENGRLLRIPVCQLIHGQADRRRRLTIAPS